MKDFLNRLILGSSYTTSRREDTPEDKRIYFTGIFSFAAGLLCIPYILIYIVHQYYIPGLAVFIFIAAFASGVYFNRQGRHQLAKNILIISSNIAIFAFSIFIGKGTGLHMLFIAAVSGTAVIFPITQRGTILFHFMTSIALFIILQVIRSYDITLFPISEEVRYLLFITSFFSAMVMVFICNYEQNSTNEQTEHSLRKNQERNDALLNAIPDMMFRINDQGMLLDYSSRKNFKLKEIEIGDSIAQIFPKALYDQIIHTSREVVAHRRIESLEFEYLFNNSIRNLEARFVKSGKNEVTVIVRDFTEQKKIENQLKFSEANLKVIFENAIQGFILVGRNREVLSYNSKIKNLILSYTEQAIEVGDRLFEQPSELQEIFTQAYDAALSGVASKKERELILTNGNLIFIEVGYTPAYDKNGEVYGVLINATDITAQKKYERELENAKNEAEAATKAKSDFLSNMSHEIRTPLNAIIGFTDLLLQEKLNKNLNESIQAIKYSSENLHLLINDILDLSKIDAGKITLEKIDFNIKNLLTQTSNLMRIKAIDKGINFECYIDESVPDYLVGDPVRLNQILLNLTSNAVKFTEKGAVTIKITTTFKSKEQVILKISVKDTGIGIREDQLENIFDSFTQAESYITRKYGGTGLGLTITKKLVELIKGDISIHSVLNHGSEFIVELPFQLSNKVSLKEEKNQPNYALLKGVRVLLAEDNNFNLLLLSKILSKWDTTIDIANNGLEVLDLMRKNQYDIVLMDIQMPEMNGLEATEYIRKNSSDIPQHNIPIIAISADAYNESRSVALKSGMTDYITKPFKQQELFEILLKNLPHRQQKAPIILQDEHEKLYEEESPTLDIQYLREHIASDEKILKELLSLYQQTTAFSLTKLEDEYKSGNREGMKNTAHKMKSSFLSIGYRRTSKILMLIEKNAFDLGNDDFMQKLITIVRSDFKKSEEAIKVLMGN